MIFTNKYALPGPIVSAIKRDPYRKEGNISVTELIKPPRMRQLEIRHDKEITVDVSEQIWALLGQSVHSVLERADTTNHLAEERLTVELHGWVISGRPDLLDPDMILSDYKVTSVYSFLLGEKKEWDEQLNLYAWLYRKNGFEVKGLRIVAVLRDWLVSRAEREPDYPKAGVLVKNIPLWSPEEQEVLVGTRVRLHQQAEKLSDDELPLCSPSERWQKEDSWAVKKAGNKKAYRVFDNEVAAQAMAVTSGNFVVEFRPGESIRCLRYCRAASFCSFGRKVLEQAKLEPDPVDWPGEHATVVKAPKQRSLGV